MDVILTVVDIKSTKGGRMKNSPYLDYFPFNVWNPWMTYERRSGITVQPNPRFFTVYWIYWYLSVLTLPRGLYLA